MIEKRQKEGYTEETDDFMTKTEEKPKPNWSRYIRRIMRRLKIEKVNIFVRICVNFY